MRGNSSKSTVRHIAALAVIVIASISPPSVAHIVEPQEFHPVAESYRRAMFVLNLNPVRWDLVEKDVAQMAAGHLTAEDTGRFTVAVRSAIARVEMEAQISTPTPTMRLETARRVFELSTESVAEILKGHLELAMEHSTSSEQARMNFDTALQLWAAFEHEVKASDLTQFRSLGAAWLRCATSLGRTGIDGVGAVPRDVEVFASEAKRIVAYVNDNFASDYSAPDEGRLAPLPTRSATYDSAANIPVTLPPGSNINKQLPRPRQVLTMGTLGVDESETVLIALGDMAFDSPYIFGEPARSLGMSCTVCHNKGVTNPKLFIPGLSAVGGGMDVSNSFFAPHANNGHFDPLDTPDLRGIRFLAPYGRNGRFASLREFTRNVIVNEFNGAEPDPLVLDGMIAYMNEFDFLPNEHLERDGSLTREAPTAALRGEVLFNKSFEQMNGKSCASCHKASNHFIDGLRHDIGSTTLSEAYARDGALDTPTLLGIKHTPPYFHDGSLPTLQSVSEWFNEQFALDLSDAELSDLTAYVDTVGDGVDAIEETMYTLDAEMEEFYFFLSTYEFLSARDKTGIIDTLMKTVELEVDAHKWDVQDLQYLPVLDQFASLMFDAYTANQMGDADTANEAIKTYRALYEEYKPVLK